MEYFTPKCFLPLWLMMAVVLPFSVFAQGNVSITVYEEAGGKALTDAVVRISPLSKTSQGKGSVLLSDKAGMVQFAWSEPVLVHVSYLGYTSITDTLSAAQSRSYHLVKSTANIDDVVITGQYSSGTSAKESIYQVEIYTAQDIREKGASNLRELLEGALDIDCTHDEVFGSGISLQGVAGEGVKILVDGVPLVGRNSGVLDISQVSLSNIERVEVIKGPMSAIYGTDAMGGVMNLISKSSQADKYDINLKGYYESVGQYNAELNGGLNLGKSQIFVSGGRNFFGGYSAMDTSRHKDWAPKEQYFGNVKYVYNTGKFKLGTSLSFMRELLIDRGDLMANSDYAFDTHYLTWRPVGSVFSTIPINDFSKVDVLMAYTGYVQFIDVYQKDLVTLAQTLSQGNGTNDTSIYHDIIGRATYTLSALNKKISFQGGLDIDQEFTHQTLIAPSDESMGDYAVFSSALFKPIVGLDIQPALRFAYNTKYNSPLIPNLNIKYTFAKYFSLRASYGMAYRAPSLQELYLSFHDSNHNIDGNPNLIPEKGNSASLEFDFQTRWDHQSFKIANTGFFNKINNYIDYIISDASSSPATYEYFNINNYMTAGAEQLAQYTWERLTLDAGINYIWYQISLGQSGVPPSHMFSPDATFKATYTIPKAEIGIRVSYKYTGKKPLFSLTSGNADEQGYLESYGLLNAALMRDFWKHRIQLTAGVKNILNVNNINTVGAVPFGHTFSDDAEIAWGRTYFVSLNLHFSK